MKLRITLEGRTYDVDVELVEEPQTPPGTPAAGIQLRQAPRVPLPPPPRSRRTPRSDEKTCRSPLAGVVVSIAVSLGQKVEKNDLLAVIEAMKMESKILALGAGAVKTVGVTAGEAVKPGQILIELE